MAAADSRRYASNAGHTSTVSCLAVHDEHKLLYSGSTDGTVRVCIATLSWLIHMLTAGSLNAHSLALACCDVCSPQVRVWTWETGTFEEKIPGGIPAGGAIECLILQHPWLFAGLAATMPQPGAVRVWQVDSKFDQTLLGHAGTVSCLEHSTLHGHAGTVFCLEQGGNYLFSGGEDMGVIVATCRTRHHTAMPALDLPNYLPTGQCAIAAITAH